MRSSRIAPICLIGISSAQPKRSWQTQFESKRGWEFIHAIETVRTIFNWCSTHRRAFRFNW